MLLSKFERFKARPGKNTGPKRCPFYSFGVVGPVFFPERALNLECKSRAWLKRDQAMVKLNQ